MPRASSSKRRTTAGSRTTTIWDTADRKSRVIDHLGNEVETRYDSNSNVTTTIQRDKSSDFSSPADTYISAFSYDGLDRLVRSVDPAKNIVETFYDSRSNVVRTSDGVRGSGNAGNIVEYRYDALNRVLEVERKLTTTGRGDGSLSGSIITRSQYDDDSALVAQIDHNGNTTSYQYDHLGRMLAVIYADKSKRSNVYNTDSQVASWTDPNGTLCNMSYDGLGRLLRRDVTPGTGVKGTTKELFHYDGASRTTLVQNDDIFSTPADDVPVRVRLARQPHARPTREPRRPVDALIAHAALAPRRAIPMACRTAQPAATPATSPARAAAR